MCRLSSEMFVAAGGGSAFATIATFAKVHWDAIRDRKAFKAAKERARQQGRESSALVEPRESD